MTGSITDILPSAFAVLGLPGPDPLDLAERVGAARRIVLVLVDGLGYHLLPRAAASSAFFADVHAGRIGHLDRLECTLPSTTPTSLVSLGTGVLPGEHGILGFTLNIPGTDRVLTHIFWRDDPPPQRWQPVPTVFALGAAAGIRSSVVLPAMFAGSGLTRSAYGGAGFIGLGKGDDHVAAVGHALDTGASFVYAYTSAVDTAAHAHGIASRQWADAVAGTGRLLERLIAALPRDTALLITADHGGLDVPAGAARIDMAADPRLTAGVRVVAGEPRFRYLHTEPGAAEDVRAAWTSVLGPAADVLSRDEAVASGLFGSVRAEHLLRVGDVVVISRAETAILASGYEPPEVAKLVGFHGARTPEETAIPLLTFAADNCIA
jgi:hypothetical protein